MDWFIIAIEISTVIVLLVYMYMLRKMSKQEKITKLCKCPNCGLWYVDGDEHACSIEKPEQIYWKPIEEYFKGEYDWVLVRMYDGDYPCIPCVAEYRTHDGNWHMNDDNYSVLPFPVVEFADMELISSTNVYTPNHKYDPKVLENQLNEISSNSSSIPIEFRNMMDKFNKLT